MKKDFDTWNEKKKALDAGNHQPPLVSEGEIWWASIGENVGSEIGGNRRLSSKLGTLDDADFLQVIEGFSSLYVKQFPAISGGAAGKSRM